MTEIVRRGVHGGKRHVTPLVSFAYRPCGGGGGRGGDLHLGPIGDFTLKITVSSEKNDRFNRAVFVVTMGARGRRSPSQEKLARTFSLETPSQLMTSAVGGAHSGLKCASKD